MNYNEINKLGDKITNISHLLSTPLSDKPIIFEDYINSLENSRHGLFNYSVYNYTYLFKTEEFITKFKDNLIYWWCKPRQENGMLYMFAMLYQLNRNFHNYSEVALYTAPSNKDIRSHIVSSLYYKDYNDIVRFHEENKHIHEIGDYSENIGIKNLGNRTGF